MGGCRRRGIGILLGGLALLLAGCTADQKPSALETALATMAKDVVIPMTAKNRKNPLPLDDKVMREAGEIFGQSCSICHGADGRAETRLGQAMYPPALDLNSPHVQSWDESELFWIIQNGVRLTGMPAWRRILSEEDTWKLVHFIRNLPRWNTRNATQETAAAAAKTTPKTEEERIAYGRTLYRQEGCFMCHQLDGEGGTLGPDLSVEGDRGRTDEWLIGHFKDPPAYTKGSLMPPFTNLTAEQLQSLVTFLQNQKTEG